ncbi:uncharacterized protein LOC124261975 [Haliotis rubra]|uniref:uncharacterized protein LOC124261975 n=1 Tax=Haliotis rubra TaxID=36100 RepID=UPI001EE562D0|nr:uncharacterized protein LOC124261975 [Haliotis rubra]
MSPEMEVVFTLMLLSLLANIADAGRIQECTQGWKRVNRKCYKLMEEELTRVKAYRRCLKQYNGSLATIANEEENEAVQDLVHGHNDSWIALRHLYGRYNMDPLTFSKFEGRPIPRRGQVCVHISPNGSWRLARCNVHSPFVCERRADCDTGWFGERNCDGRCHCYLNYGCHNRGCPYGCEPGWTGYMCAQRRKKTKVSSYCLKEREGEYSLNVSFTRRELYSTYVTFGAVDAKGVISPRCKKINAQMTRRDEIRFRVQVHNVSGVLESKCPFETLSGGILQWTFRLEKKGGIESFEDEEHQVQCDLSEADGVYDTQSIEIEQIRERSLIVATQTRVNIRTYVAYPDALEPVANVSLGGHARLVVTLPEGDDFVNPFFYPRACQALSPDGKVSFPLTSPYGCRKHYRFGFGIMEKVSGVIQSGTFPMFRLPGYTELVFSCTLVVPHLNHVKYQAPVSVRLVCTDRINTFLRR